MASIQASGNYFSHFSSAKSKLWRNRFILDTKIHDIYCIPTLDITEQVLIISANPKGIQLKTIH